MSDQSDHESTCRSGCGKYNVLFVDDEELVLKSLERAMHRENFNLLTALSGDIALDILRDNEIQVLITDYRMPGLNGIELAKKVAEINPDIIRIILSGYSEASTIIEAINCGSIYKFLTKPWHPDTLKMNIRLAIERYELNRENARLTEQLLSLNDELQGMNSSLKEKVEERTLDLREVRDGLKNTIKATISMLSHIMDVHNIDISGHGRRVSQHCRRMGTLMNLADDEIEQLERAAMLHDIGKIFISQKILSKSPDSYDDIDKRFMRLHAVEGYSVLNRIPGFDRIAQMIRHHHENYDGSGYPDQLAGTEIPQGARIIAVADWFERLRHPTAGNSSMSVKDACDVLKSDAEKHLDPELTELFVEKLLPELEGREERIVIPVISAIPGLRLAVPLIDCNGSEIYQCATVLNRDIISDILKNDAINPTQTMLEIDPIQVSNKKEILNYYI